MESKFQRHIGALLSLWMLSPIAHAGSEDIGYSQTSLWCSISGTFQSVDHVQPVALKHQYSFEVNLIKLNNSEQSRKEKLVFINEHMKINWREAMMARVSYHQLVNLGPPNRFELIEALVPVADPLSNGLKISYIPPSLFSNYSKLGLSIDKALVPQLISKMSGIDLELPTPETGIETKLYFFWEQSNNFVFSFGDPAEIYNIMLTCGRDASREEKVADNASLFVLDSIESLIPEMQRQERQWPRRYHFVDPQIESLGTAGEYRNSENR